MKNRILLIVLGLVFIVSCNNETDLYPLSQGSAEAWYSTETEIEMALMDIYKSAFWATTGAIRNDAYSDDITNRVELNDVTNGNQNGQWSTGSTLWTNSYKAIGRANTILAALEKPELKSNVSEKAIEMYKGEALFFRAAQYGNLVNHFGDVVYTEKLLTIDEAFQMSRTPKSEVMAKVYRDLDLAAESLPASYSSTEAKRATKGVAYAFKARIAIRNSDFREAADAAKACMDLDVYKLHSSFADLFLSSTRNSKEGVFTIPGSLEFGNFIYTNEHLPRNVGAYAKYTPTWDLAAAFLCTDGLPIDESPDYDPSNPFENRDPRMAMTIIPVGKDTITSFLGIDYNPSPYAEKVMNHNTGKMIVNKDSRINGLFASHTGMLFSKAIDATWTKNSFRTDPDIIIIRYADVLYMYAEAKIELNEIDQSVLDAINMVRARAYGVSKESVLEYPAVTTTDQAELRSVIRFERRMEFVKEGIRYNDLLRWRIAEKALNQPNYGLISNDDLKKLIDQDLWFFPGTPEIDENGIADYSKFATAKQMVVLSERKFNERQYLWAIPSKEILINKNLEPQNPGY